MVFRPNRINIEAVVHPFIASGDLLLRASIQRNAPRTRLRVVVEPGAKHEASAWRGRLPAALRFLYGQSRN
jgi:hypothetical protein